ncbi:GNAT family N-acetyltransferase [Pseudomonas gingeri]|uniref:GNAT family N-acetyltransferase n=1 Tax=Pseudomonas gingeri TaxID=117681 RepID=A0A7Y7XHQ3_9PSED|nr:GNAT family N-acetyltransferase [Pseudomonas gingeri]NWC00028.1 GNAT family N-acetyltransferase [Pseudomonas gingeri]
MSAEKLDYQPVLVGPTLLLKPLKQDDFEALYEAAKDPEIWAGHPAKERYKKPEFEAYFSTLLSTKKALAVHDASSARMVGTSSFYSPPDRPECIAIGFTFLIREKWGGASNFELKTLMIEHAFSAFDEVYFHIGPANIRSQKATMKLGAVFLYEAELKISASPAPCKCYSLTKATWEKSGSVHN